MDLPEQISFLFCVDFQWIFPLIYSEFTVIFSVLCEFMTEGSLHVQNMNYNTLLQLSTGEFCSCPVAYTDVRTVGF